MGLAITVLIVVVVVLCIPAIIFMERAQRRIPVNYAKRVQGNKMMGGQSTYIPLKVNSAGVIPIIFASCLLYFPAQLAALFNVGWLTTFANWCSSGWLNWLLTLLLIVFFAYFYTSITFNPLEVSDNLKKQGGFIPGIRPGKPTSEYLERILKYVIFIGACGLTIIAIIPFFFNGVFHASVSFAGTSLIIIVSVILEAVKQTESMMVVRNYKGFLND